MASLKHILIEELLNALDDIQTDIPIILDYYMNTDLGNDDNLHNDIDIDLLTMTIIGLRDSAKRICNTIHTANTKISEPEIISVSPQVKQFTLSMLLHIHMLTDQDSIYNSNIIGNKSLFTEE